MGYKVSVAEITMVEIIIIDYADILKQGQKAELQIVTKDKARKLQQGWGVTLGASKMRTTVLPMLNVPI
jgi:hypothetical protein